MIFTIILAGIIFISVVVDQITKLLVSSGMELYQTIPIINDVFHITYIRNEGAAFGMLSEHRWVFMIISSVAIVGLGIYLFRFCKESKLIKTGIALIIGGGIGNMIDRIALGYVVDMIDCRFIDFYVFNIADSCVCVGAGIVILGLILEFADEKKKNKQSSDEKGELSIKKAEGLSEKADNVSGGNNADGKSAEISHRGGEKDGNVSDGNNKSDGNGSEKTGNEDDEPSDRGNKKSGDIDGDK